ncbi:MAG: hypothetical protein ABDH49_05520 [Candidatus Hydrothermales bacterium]
MKKLVLTLIKISLLKASGLHFWGLDRTYIFNYIGTDSIRTPGFQGVSSSISLISITTVLPDTSLALYQRISPLFPISRTGIRFIGSYTSTLVYGFALPVYGNENNLLPEGLIIPDTFYIFHNPTYTWTPPGMNQTFITDIDRDQFKDTVLITQGIGRIMGIDTIQLTIGQVVTVHIRMEYQGKGRFGNGDSLSHSLVLDRWWAPLIWKGQIQTVSGLIKEVFYQVTSSPNLLLKANRSTGYGSSLLESTGVKENDKISFTNGKDKYRSYVLTKDRSSLESGHLLIDLAGKKVNKLKNGIYLQKLESKGISKIIFLR